MKKWKQCWNVLLIFRWSHDKYRKKPDYQFEPETGQMASRRNTLLHRSGVLCVSRNNSIVYIFWAFFFIFTCFMNKNCAIKSMLQNEVIDFLFSQRWTKWSKFVLPWYVDMNVIRHMWHWPCSFPLKKSFSIFFSIFFGLLILDASHGWRWYERSFSGSITHRPPVQGENNTPGHRWKRGVSFKFFPQIFKVILFKIFLFFNSSIYSKLCHSFSGVHLPGVGQGKIEQFLVLTNGRGMHILLPRAFDFFRTVKIYLLSKMKNEKWKMKKMVEKKEKEKKPSIIDNTLSKI